MQPRRRELDFYDADARESQWYQFLLALDEATLYQGWAADFLRDLQDTVQRTHRVTPAQRRALQHIEAGVWP